jgi:hypothetical protein
MRASRLRGARRGDQRIRCGLHRRAIPQSERHAAGLGLVQDVARVNLQCHRKADVLGGGRSVGGAAG